MAEDKDSKREDSAVADAGRQTGGSGQAGSEPKGAAKSGRPKESGKKVKPAEPPLLNEPALQQSTGKGGRTKRAGRGPVWLALIIALLGLAAAGYTYWQFELYKKADLLSAESREQRTLSQLQDETGVLEQSLLVQGDQLAGQQQAIEELRDRIAASRRQIGEITHVSRKSWMLAEAEYLLRLANQRLAMEQETASALALLQSADQILLETDDINLYSVRAEIAKEKAALRAAGNFDVEGAFLTLAALADQLSQLPLLSPQSTSGPSMAAGSDGLSKVLLSLEKLVTVRHREQPVAPLLPPEQHYYVQQNLRLMLEQAQLALLQRKPQLYSESLGKAERWIQDYFELNGSSTALLESIGELRQLIIAPKMPDISGSLALLKEFLSNPELAPDAALGTAQ